MSRLSLITGGARSGKSRYALALASSYASKVFIATAQPLDDEMRRRIEEHRRQRGSTFVTIEAPLEVAGALRSLPAGAEVAVIDCLTVWLGNLLHRYGNQAGGFAEVMEFVAALKAPPCDIIVVSNEVGAGIVPANPLARQFRELAGSLNQQVAAIADAVILMVCGIPVPITGKGICLASSH